jgi:hypothetical protein
MYGVPSRKIIGTTDWTKYECVLDVSGDAINLVFGFGLSGNGRAWVDDFQFDVVGADVPTTNALPPQEISSKPIPAKAFFGNLDFEK